MRMACGPTGAAPARKSRAAALHAANGGGLFEVRNPPMTAECGRRIVRIQPTTGPCNHRPEDLWKIVLACMVNYRNPYPLAVDGRYGTTFSKREFVGASHSSGWLKNAWHFHRDGRFMEMMALPEDAGRFQTGSSVRAALPQPKYLEPIWNLFGLGEVYAFASNRATLTGKPHTVSITFIGMDGRMLDIRTEDWAGLDGCYVSRMYGIPLGPTIVRPNLSVGMVARLALDATSDMLGQFDMDRDAPRVRGQIAPLPRPATGARRGGASAGTAPSRPCDRQ